MPSRLHGLCPTRVIHQRPATKRGEAHHQVLRFEIPAASWSLESSELLHLLVTDPETRLSTAEAVARLSRFGRNLLRSHAVRRVVLILADQFHSAAVLLLAVAALAALARRQFRPKAVLSSD